MYVQSLCRIFCKKSEDGAFIGVGQLEMAK